MDQKVFTNKQYSELKQEINKTSATNTLLVRGRSSYANSGAKAFISDLLDVKPAIEFYDFDTNPQLNDLKRGIEVFKNHKIDLIIAIGGGSVLDMAKLISWYAHQDSDLEALVLGKEKAKNKNTPLLAIPTTAGTGAEATHFAVLYINKNKYSVASPMVLPKYVYLSSEFSSSASAYLTACTGLDAFSQAIESVWSVNANQESVKYGLEAIQLVWNNLYEAVTNNTLAAKQEMQQASYLAGKAINITKTTAPHALSYAFTSYYNIPHGHAVALSLPFFLNYNYAVSLNDCTDPRGPIAVQQRIDSILEIMSCTVTESEEKLQKFFASIGININIKELIQHFDKNTIAENVNLERLSNNPRKVANDAIAAFLEK